VGGVVEIVPSPVLELWPARPGRKEWRDGGVSFDRADFHDPAGICCSHFKRLTGLTIEPGTCVRVRVPEEGWEIL
jgi:hypothetical protein